MLKGHNKIFIVGTLTGGFVMFSALLFPVAYASEISETISPTPGPDLLGLDSSSVNVQSNLDSLSTSMPFGNDYTPLPPLAGGLAYSNNTLNSSLASAGDVETPGMTFPQLAYIATVSILVLSSMGYAISRNF